MLSMMRPAQSNTGYGYPFIQRFLVEESLQTKKRRKDQIPQSAPISHAARLSSAPVSASLPPVKQHPFQEYSKNMIDYFTLLNTRLISDFLRCDRCYKVSDSYALSMVFIYFIRAEFTAKEYTRENFFVALYLALDMEDDVEEFKYELFPWCLGKEWKHKYPQFLQCRDKLWKRMNYRALVSKATCDDIMRIMPSPYWDRVREENHGGAIRKCRMPPHPNDDLPVGPFGAPVPCVHCFFHEEERKPLLSEMERSSSSSSQPKIEDDIFYTADESLSTRSGSRAEVFNDAKTEDTFAFADFKSSSSGYRVRSAALASIDTEEDEVQVDVVDKGDDDDDDDDDDVNLWVNCNIKATANHVSSSDETKEIFALSSSEDEKEDWAKDKKSCESFNDLSDIFWDSSDDSEPLVKRNGEESQASSQSKREPRRAQRSFSRINLRDADVPKKRLSPTREIFSTEV